LWFICHLTDWYAYAEMSPAALSWSNDDPQTCRRKRSVEDADEEKMEESCPAAKVDACSSSDVMQETKRPKTGDSTGKHASHSFNPRDPDTENS